jgi:hypothetical protein
MARPPLVQASGIENTVENHKMQKFAFNWKQADDLRGVSRISATAAQVSRSCVVASEGKTNRANAPLKRRTRDRVTEQSDAKCSCP